MQEHFSFESYEEALEQAIHLSAGKPLEEFLDQVLLLRSSTGDSFWALPEALALWRLDRSDDARACLESAPSDIHEIDEYWLLLGMACSGFEDGKEVALNAYQRALDINPRRADAHYNLANILSDDDPVSAEKSYLDSLRIDPFKPFTWYNFGLLLREQLRFKEAIFVFKSSLVLMPDHPDGWSDLGLSFMGNDDFTQAESCFYKAISYDKKHLASHVNMGTLLVKCLRLNEALVFLERGVELEKSSSHALWNLGLCHLLLGRFESGWRFYEARLRTHLVPLESVPTGGPRLHKLQDSTIKSEGDLVVWCEQGLGDSIQFSRYLNLLNATGFVCEFQCPRELLVLFRDWFNAPWLKLRIKGDQTDLKDLRPHIPLMSLPALFNTDLFSIPATIPYLRPPGDPPKNLQLKDPPGGLSIGIVWAANASNREMYRHKSLPLEILMPVLLDLLSLDLIDLHSLQVGVDAVQLQPWRDHPRIIDWNDQLKDFADTAYVLNQLDLVITVDTAVAHLAGALNKPTWLLLPRNPDFRWLRDRLDSPWYPGCMRLFRQKEQGDWVGVIRELQKALDRLFLLDLTELAAAKLH